MPKVFLILILLVPGTVLAQDGLWRTVSPEECNFSIDVPGSLTLTKSSQELQGVTIRSFIYDVQHGSMHYSVNCSDYPIASLFGTRDQLMDVLKGSARARVGGEPLELEEIEVNGYSGIEYVEYFGADAAIYHRAIVVGEQLYQLDVGDLSGEGKENASRFFKSFDVE